MRKVISKDILQYHSTERYYRREAGKISQKAISVKLDNTAVAALDEEARCTGVPRNRLINMAVMWYLSELDTARYEATLVDL